MQPAPDFNSEVEAIVDTVYSRYHYDFRDYSRVSLRRRLNAAVSRLGYGDIGELHARLRDEPKTFGQLLDYMTVQVSELFRDPHYFLAVRESVIPVLQTYPSLKLWVAGCSTGEEAYSLAILLHEEGLLDRSMIYATDINPRALDAARAGVYAIDRVPLFTQNHQQSGGKTSLADYYTAAYGNIRLHASLREHIVFADHSLSTDTVFAEMHLISCRNVLIYFDAALQARALHLFADSLCMRGFLGIGAKESLRFTAGGEQFSDFVRADRIFRRVH